MDFRSYLDLEASLQRVLLRAWQPQASALMEQINTLIAEGKFDDARQVVSTISFVDVGDECRNYIKAILQSCILYGGAMAGGMDPSKTFVSASNHDGLLDLVVDNFMQLLAYNVTQSVQQDALQSIARAEVAPATKAEKQRYVKDFVSFQQAGNSQLKMISSLHSSRLSTWGFTAEAEVLGYTEYQLTAVLDGRTSAFCRAINGKRFKVADATSMINRVLKVQDPNDLKTVQPWPKQDKASIEMFSKASSAELTRMGLHIPPFHPNCRTLCTKVGSAPKIQMPEVPQEARIIPEKKSTPQDFQDIGNPITPDQLDLWNTYVNLKPVDFVSKVSGLTQQDVMEAKKKVISFDQNGDIKFAVKNTLPGDLGSKLAMAMTYDPYASVMKVMSALFLDSTPTAAATNLGLIMNGMVDVGLSMGAEYLTMAVDGDSVRSYSDMGFVPSTADWYDLKNDILTQLDAGDLTISSLSEHEQQAVIDVLSSRSEDGLQALLNLPFTIDGQKVGEYLLSREQLGMRLPLNNPNAVQYFRKATA
jgi:hypothetical protein